MNFDECVMQGVAFLIFKVLSYAGESQYWSIFHKNSLKFRDSIFTCKKIAMFHAMCNAIFHA